MCDIFIIEKRPTGREGTKHQMLYLHHRPEVMNKGAKFQSTDLGLCLVCKNETGIMGVRHVKI